MTIEDDLEKQHLGWTKKQGYVLSGGGKAESFYKAERGFPFVETDLPHHHLLKGDTHDAFKPNLKGSKLLVAGAWNRSLFCGGWKFSSDKEERVYNVQTNNLFIDFRVPRTRAKVLGASKAQSLDELTPHELRLYARQHIFAGITLVTTEENKPVATRHHFIDWNFVGVSRSRPNKWWISANEDCSSWKEYAYAKDDNGQHYYFEQWDRRDHGMPEPMLAMRIAPNGKRKSGDEEEDQAPQQDGLLVLVGDHFNYVMSRKLSGKDSSYEQASLVDLVDAAVEKGDLETARAYLGIEGGHGLVSKNWTLDCAIPHWNEGEDVISIGGSKLQVVGTDLDSCTIVWKGHNWELYDCSFESIDALKQFLC